VIHFKGLFFKGELQIQGRIAIRPYTPAHTYFSQTIFD